jgi:hypothetical protein
MNDNCNTPNPCENVECCVEIVNTECIKHGEDPLNTLLTELLTTVNTSYDLQSIGGVNGSDLVTAINRLADVLETINGKTYDLSGLTVDGVAGGAFLTADEAIKFIINHLINP